MTASDPKPTSSANESESHVSFLDQTKVDISLAALGESAVIAILL